MRVVHRTYLQLLLPMKKAPCSVQNTLQKAAAIAVEVCAFRALTALFVVAFIIIKHLETD